MKKILAPVILGFVLLAPSSRALAEPVRPVEPRWSIRPPTKAPRLLDFARWLSKEASDPLLAPDEDVVPGPGPLPAPDPADSGSPDVICPDRRHCPIG